MLDSSIMKHYLNKFCLQRDSSCWRLLISGTYLNLEQVLEQQRQNWPLVRNYVLIVTSVPHWKLWKVTDKAANWAKSFSSVLFTVAYPELFWSQYTGLGSQTQTPKLSKVQKLIHLKIDNDRHWATKAMLLGIQNAKTAKICRGFTPGPHWGEFTVPPRLPSCKMGFLLIMLLEKPAPKKMVRYSIDLLLLIFWKWIDIA